MNLVNIADAREWFEVLQTTDRSQTAVMRLKPGGASGPAPDSHENSDQVLIVLEGEALAEVQGKSQTIRRGDVVLIPAGTPHRFSNESDAECVTFSVYAPPAYPAGEKG